MPNRLQYEKSPYLLQHAENPVDWRPWGADAFEEARREDKPVLLSIGYSTCHWCHVMAHESFEDEAVAEAVNGAFLPIKVDREERPDVDAVYMAACIAQTGSGGWPLTVLLTPEQKPFWAGTYLPRRQLLSLLDQAARLWREDRGTLLAAGDALTEFLRREEAARPGVPKRELVESGAALFRRMFDRQWGGFGQAPKFPAAHNLLFLLCYAGRTGDVGAREMAESTLEHMYRGRALRPGGRRPGTRLGRDQRRRHPGPAGLAGPSRWDRPNGRLAGAGWPERSARWNRLPAGMAPGVRPHV